MEKNLPQLLRIGDVVRVTGLSRPSIYLHIRKGIFPQQIKIGPRASAWLLDDIKGWLNRRIDARDQA